MVTSTRKRPASPASAQKLAAQKAEEVAALLHSFASTLISLDALTPSGRTPTPTPRNWWRLQAGRFKSDPGFPNFVAQIQAARKHEG